MHEEEEWRPIKDYEGLYEVSSFGRVKALERYVENNGGMQHRSEKILKPSSCKRNQNRQTVVLCKDGTINPKLVHRLVAETFINNPDNKPNVDHIDTDPTNNRVDNLRWVTQHENAMNPLTRTHNSESKKGHPFYGRPLTLEERKKISDGNKGLKRSEETKKKLSESHIGKSHPNPYKGYSWKVEGGKRLWY